MGRGGSNEVGDEVGSFDDDMGSAVLFDHVEALLNNFGAFLGLGATGEGDGNDADAAWEQGEGSQGVRHRVRKDGMDKPFKELPRLAIAESDSQALSGSTSLVPAGALAVAEVADAKVVVGVFLGGEVAEALSGTVQAGPDVVIDEMGKLVGCEIIRALEDIRREC